MDDWRKNWDVNKVQKLILKAEKEWVEMNYIFMTTFGTQIFLFKTPGKAYSYLMFSHGCCSIQNILLHTFP